MAPGEGTPKPTTPRRYKASELTTGKACEECDSTCFISSGSDYLICYHCFLAAQIEKLEGGTPRDPDNGILCDQVEPVTLAEHTKYVEAFLNEMYATMIDPCEQPKMKVAELCELLVKTAREQREALAAHPSPAPTAQEITIGYEYCPHGIAISPNLRCANCELEAKR